MVRSRPHVFGDKGGAGRGGTCVWVYICREADRQRDRDKETETERQRETDRQIDGDRE